MKCPNCGAENADGKNFCGDCGAYTYRENVGSVQPDLVRTVSVTPKVMYIPMTQPGMYYFEFPRSDGSKVEYTSLPSKYSVFHAKEVEGGVDFNPLHPNIGGRVKYKDVSQSETVYK